MSRPQITRGGIIAAGEGSRLKADGWTGSKAMAVVGGRPLIAHALDRFRAAGVCTLSIIINEASLDCRDYLEQRRPMLGLELDLIVRTTPSSYASFAVLAERLAGERAVISTVDSILAEAHFKRFVQTAADASPDAFVLGVTDYVDDDSPLWAELDPLDGRVRRLGGAAASHVTAGFYVLPAGGAPEAPQSFERLREYLNWLVAQGLPVYGAVMPRVFDIDRARDIEQAEQMLAGMGRVQGRR